MNEVTTLAGESPPRPDRRWYRLALTVTVLLVLAVLASLPLAVLSM